MTSLVVFVLIAGGVAAIAALLVAILTGMNRKSNKSDSGAKGSRTPHIEVKKAVLLRIEHSNGKDEYKVEDKPASKEPPAELYNFKLLTRLQLDESELRRISKMAESCPRPPALMSEVMSQLTIGSYDVRKFSNLAHRDTILASQILRTVNSAFFGMKNEVSSVQRAVVLLGFNNVKDIALKLALDKVFIMGNSGIREAYSKFWLASFAASSICSQAARALDIEKGSELSTGALLSYLGNFAFMANYQDHCEEYVSTGSLLKQVELEQEVSGANSAIIGSLLADAWTLPATVKSCIESSLVPLTAPASECDEGLRTQAGLCYACARAGDYFAFNSLKSFDAFDFSQLDGPEYYYIHSYFQDGELKNFPSLFLNKQFTRDLDKSILATAEMLSVAAVSSNQ